MILPGEGNAFLAMRTNSVPTIDATMETAPIRSGNVTAPGSRSAKIRCPSSIAAIVVTA